MSSIGWFSLLHAKTPHSRHQRVLALDRFLFCLLYILVAHFCLVSYFQPQIEAAVLGTKSNLSPQVIADTINTRRQEKGMPALIWNEKLAQAAQKKGEDMIAKDYWSHTSPDGKEPWDFLDSVGYNYSLAGENLARNFSENKTLVEAWMASPTHRENILQQEYTEIGIALLSGQDSQANRTVVVSLFGTPATTPIAEVSRKAVQTAPAVSGKLGDSTAILGESTLARSLDFYRIGTFTVLAALVMLLFVDIWQAHRKKLPRSLSKTVAHILLLTAVAVTILIAERDFFF